MTWKVLTVGKPALAYARAGRDEYAARLEKFAKVEWIAVKASTPEREGNDLLDKSTGCFRMVLDERGRTMTSREFAEKVRGWQISTRPIALLLGGADGHSAAVRENADLLWSLSPLTLQHELALVVALEQLYRAHTILAGHPYHRD